MRIRTIKPDFWTDTLIVQLPHVVRLLYVALWNVADDHGYLLDEPERIAMEVMPREPPGVVDAAVQLLAAAGRLEWFIDADGRSYYRVAKWEDHQRVDHPAKSKIFRESSRKLAIPLSARRAVAEKYGCLPGESKDATCFYCGAPGSVHWWKLADGRPSGWVVFPGLELDHLESESGGGESSQENIVLACRSCNRGKGQKHWFDFFSSKFFANPRESARSLAPERKGKEGKGREEPSPEEAPSSEISTGASPPPAAPSPPGIFPKPDDPRVTALHGIAIASRLNARIPDAQQWVSDGVTEEILLTAIARGKKRKAGAMFGLPFLQLMLQDVRAEGTGYDAKAVIEATMATIAARESNATH